MDGVRGWFLYVLFFEIAQKLGPVRGIGLLDRLEEILLLLVIPAAAVGVCDLWRRSFAARVFLVGFAAYLVAGVMSWVGSPVPMRAALLQGLLELKFPVAVVAFWGAGRLDRRGIRGLVVPLKWTILASVLIVLLHRLAPGLHQTLLPPPENVGGLHLPGGAVVSKAMGAALQPGTLAIFTGTMAAYFTLRALRTRGLDDVLWASACWFLLLNSLERQEFAGVLILLPVVAFLARRHRDWTEKLFASSVATVIGASSLAAGLWVLAPYLRFTARSLGLLGGLEDAVAARTVFYLYGFRLAASHFPLGVGLGGFGGYAAEVTDSPIYTELGFDRFSWYREGLYMTDTFWPHVLGESGWLGLLLYLGSVLGLAVVIVRQIRPGGRAPGDPYAATALFGLLFLLSVSLTAPVFTSAFPLAVTLFWLGTVQHESDLRRSLP